MSVPPNPFQTRLEIRALRENLPDEVKNDEEFWHDIVEGETTVHECSSRFIRKHDRYIEYAKAEKALAKECQERAALLEQRAIAAKNIPLVLMQDAGLRKMELPEASLSIRALPAAIIIDDEAALPDAAFKTKREVSKTQIAALLDAGADVPGAHRSNGGEGLSIRRK